jgi:hypothetical protein
MADVVIAGGGPAGWSLASACARQGLRVTLVAPTHGWPATYGMWLDETDVLPPGSHWVSTPVHGGGRLLPREYAVLDNESVLAAFAHPGIEVVKARVLTMTATRVHLTNGEELTAPLVFDATGVRRGGVEQTAYGVVVPADLLPQGEAVFMDWRQPPGFGEPATFLYAIPLPDGRVLLEETCLARHGGLAFAELRDRLHARLGPLTGPTERVRFPVDVEPPPLLAPSLRELRSRLWATFSLTKLPPHTDNDPHLPTHRGGASRNRLWARLGPAERSTPPHQPRAMSSSAEQSSPQHHPQTTTSPAEQPSPQHHPQTTTSPAEQPSPQHHPQTTTSPAEQSPPQHQPRAATGPAERASGSVGVRPSLLDRGPIPFGAVAGFVHPATGFSLAETFRLAPVVASAVRLGPRAVRRVLWPVSARLVFRLRRRGLATLLSLTAAEHEEFFDLFFTLPDHHQRAYLSGRGDLRGTVAAMAAMFRAAPTHLRRKMVKP